MKNYIFSNSASVNVDDAMIKKAESDLALIIRQTAIQERILVNINRLWHKWSNLHQLTVLYCFLVCAN